MKEEGRSKRRKEGAGDASLNKTYKTPALWSIYPRIDALWAGRALEQIRAGSTNEELVGRGAIVPYSSRGRVLRETRRQSRMSLSKCPLLGRVGKEKEFRKIRKRIQLSVRIGR